MIAMAMAWAMAVLTASTGNWCPSDGAPNHSDPVLSRYSRL